MFDWAMEKLVIPAVVVIVLAAIFVLLPLEIYAGYKQSQSPTFTLYKNEWACTNLQRIPVTTYVMSGKVTVPVITYSEECHQWNRQP